MSFLNIWDRNASHFKQAIRTGVAALLCLYITKALGLTQGLWAAISSIIVLQSHMGATVKASVGRFLATAVGALVGAIVVSFEGNNYVSVAAAITIAVLCCTPQRLRDGYRLAGSTVISIMLGNKSQSPWFVATERFIEVSLGILIALIVAKTMWPSRARLQLRKEIQQGFTALNLVFKTVLDRYRNGTNPSMDDLLANVRASGRSLYELRQQAGYERADAEFTDQLIVEIIGHLRLIRQAVDGMELATRAGGESQFQRTADPELEQALNVTSIAFEKLSTELWTLADASAFSELLEPLYALEKKVSTTSFSLAASEYPSDDVMRFHAFIVSLRSLAQELSLTGQLLAADR
jgi:uncharacterized membrane protein YccC